MYCKQSITDIAIPPSLHALKTESHKNFHLNWLTTQEAKNISPVLPFYISMIQIIDHKSYNTFINAQLKLYPITFVIVKTEKINALLKKAYKTKNKRQNQYIFLPLPQFSSKQKDTRKKKQTHSDSKDG